MAEGFKIGILGGYFVTSIYRENKTVEWLDGEVVEYIAKKGTGLVYCNKMDARIAPRYHHLVTREEYIEEMVIKWNKLK